jgi:hypothetical protein
MNSKESLNHSACAEQMALAERELASFVGAVTELLGPEQARFSAADWLEEAELADSSAPFTTEDWRSVTVAASARLARRLSAAGDRRVSFGASFGTSSATAIDTKVSPIPSSNCFIAAVLV